MGKIATGCNIGVKKCNVDGVIKRGEPLLIVTPKDNLEKLVR